MKIGPGVSELFGVENCPLPLTCPMAYTTACTTVQAVTSRDVACRNVLLTTFTSQKVVVRRLRSTSERMCFVPRTHNTFGDRTFASAAARQWTVEQSPIGSTSAGPELCRIQTPAENVSI